MVPVRYRDLITVLFIVATATWIWAEPSPQVKAPHRQQQQSMATKDWTIPDLSSPTQPAEPKPQAPPQTPSTGPLSYTDFDPQEFDLNIKLTPGASIRDTIFDVTFRGPQGFDMVRDGGSDAQFMVAFDAGQGETLYINTAKRVGANHWRFRGSDLTPYGEQPVSWSTLNRASTLQVNTVLRDLRQSRYSRGANFMVLESDPVNLARR